MADSIQSAIAHLTTTARTAGLPPDDDIGRVIAAMGELAGCIDTKVSSIKVLPTEEILRLLRGELSTIKPEFAAHWTWRKVAAAVVAGVACLSLAAGASAMVAGSLGWGWGYGVGASESLHWNAYCQDGANVHAGFCWVPVRPVEVRR